MELPGVRPRVSSTAIDFDLEDAPSSISSKFSAGKSAEKSLTESFKNATRLWLALAAALIFLFVCASSSLFSRGPGADPSSPDDPTETAAAAAFDPPLAARGELYNGRSPAAAPVASAGVTSNFHPLTHRRRHPHRHTSVPSAGGHDEASVHPAADGEEEEDGEEMQEYPEEEADEAELHYDGHHDAETHPEFDPLDDAKQHPDEPDFVDIWDGVTHEDLHLSVGVPGLRTPLYRLPFVDGQHNGTHVIGVHAKKVMLPRFLSVVGGKRVPAIKGTYRMLMTQDGRPKPHLNHGRLIWQKEDLTSPMFLYYDHRHHTWVFNQTLDLHAPQPLAFLAHGAILPVARGPPGPHEKDNNSFKKYGAPKSVHWIVREDPGGASRPDGSVKVEADPSRSDTAHLQPLLLQKVYCAPEDGTHSHEMSSVDSINWDEEEAELFLEETEEETEEEETGKETEDEGDENHPMMPLPPGARSYQQFVTHLRTNVYHTFEPLHALYDHQQIVTDPVAFVEKFPHPDLVGPERVDGIAHDETPHPLRKPANEA